MATELAVPPSNGTIDTEDSRECPDFAPTESGMIDVTSDRAPKRLRLETDGSASAGAGSAAVGDPWIKSSVLPLKFRDPDFHTACIPPVHEKITSKSKFGSLIGAPARLTQSEWPRKAALSPCTVC